MLTMKFETLTTFVNIGMICLFIVFLKKWMIQVILFGAKDVKDCKFKVSFIKLNNQT